MVKVEHIARSACSGRSLGHSPANWKQFYVETSGWIGHLSGCSSRRSNTNPMTMTRQRVGNAKRVKESGVKMFKFGFGLYNAQFGELVQVEQPQVILMNKKT